MRNSTTNINTKKSIQSRFDSISLGVLKLEVLAMAAVILSCGFKLVTLFVV